MRLIAEYIGIIRIFSQQLLNTYELLKYFSNKDFFLALRVC